MSTENLHLSMSYRSATILLGLVVSLATLDRLAYAETGT